MRRLVLPRLRALRGTTLVAPPAGGAPALDWHGDWSHATGATAAAIGDGPSAGTRKFDQIGGVINELDGARIIANPGTLGFPATLANLFEVRITAANQGYVEPRRTTGLAIPAIGQARYYRGYLHLCAATDVIPAFPTGDDEIHPFQDGSAASQLNWGWWIYHNQGVGQWRLHWRPQASVNAFPAGRWSFPNLLAKARTYRWELCILRTGTATFKPSVRLFDESVSLTTPILGDADLLNENSSMSLADYTASSDLLFNNLANMAGLNSGINGLANIASWGAGVLPFTYAYQGAMATGIDCGWIGPYLLGNG